MVHLVPSRINYTTREVAELMFAEVYKYHRLNNLIRIKQKMSSAYHPETDGATKCANQTSSLRSTARRLSLQVMHHSS